MDEIFVREDERRAAVTQSRSFRLILSALGLEKERVLDVGCGYGEYLAHFGPGSVGITTTSREVAYGAHAGFDIRMGNAEALASLELPALFDAVWANNLFEHLLSPHAFLMELKAVLKPGGRLVLGVPITLAAPMLVRLARFRGALASNHIGFYTRHTLRVTVERAGWKVVAIRPFVFRNALLDRLCAPFAPHLYLVAENDTSFAYPEKKRNEWRGDSRYARLLALGGQSPAVIKSPDA